MIRQLCLRRNNPYGNFGFFVSKFHADLELLGQRTSVHGTYNLIYDIDLNITWYDYAYMVYGSTWHNPMNWSEVLHSNGYFPYKYIVGGNYEIP